MKQELTPKTTAAPNSRELVLDGTTRIQIIDSHTGGEPTRLVLSGGPPLGKGPLADRLAHFRDHYDAFRTAIVDEPRGSEAIVGAVLCEPCDPTCSAGVIFFNNVGYLGMCGHGTIGVAVTLAHLGRIDMGQHRIETPVGIVEAQLHTPFEVTVTNVPSYRFQADVILDVDGIGPVTGDIAWGGNWFFLTKTCPVPILPQNLEALTSYAWSLRRSLQRQGFTGDKGAEIDHIELFGPATSDAADSKNFVLCPGGSYDRSPCGTGTSAKVACLHADGLLNEGQIWRQESLIGSIFHGSFSIRGGLLYPKITGTAYVTGESSLLLQPEDPFRWGLRSR